MKEFFGKHWVAVLALVLAVVLVIPVSAGIKLDKKYNKVFSSFDKKAAKSDSFGNSLVNDMDKAIGEAENCIDAASFYLSSDHELVSAAKEAVKSYRRLKAPHKAYEAYLDVCAAVERMYNAASKAADESDDDAFELEAAHMQLLHHEDIIRKEYSEEYNEAVNKANDLLSGFPKSLIAKLYNIGN